MPNATNPREIALALRADCGWDGRMPPGHAADEVAKACGTCDLCEAADAIEALLEQRKRVLALCDSMDEINDGEVREQRLTTDEIRAALEEPK